MYRIEWKKEIPALLVILLSFVAGTMLYGGLPERLPMHWNIRGEVDSYAEKSVYSVFFFPGITLLIYFLLLFIPFIDPRRERYAQFQGPYRLIRYGLVVFMTLLYAVTTLAPAGFASIQVHRVIAGGIGALFILIGAVLPRVKSNWFVGIRTPWTIENEEVWRKTHRLGAVLFMIAGSLTAAAAFLSPVWTFGVLIGSALAAGFVPVVYSWVLYRKIVKGK